MEEDKVVVGGEQNPGMVIAPNTTVSPGDGGMSPAIQPQPAPISNLTPNTPIAAQPQQMPVNNVPVGPTQVQGPPAPMMAQGGGTNLTVNPDGLSWTGPEFAQQEKSSNWYTICVLAALALGGIIYLLTGDFMSSLVVAVAIGVLGFYSMRRPKDTSYILTDYGVSIGDKRFTYEQFRSFTVTNEGSYMTITFLPFKRFATTAGLYYQGNEEDKIVDFLSARLPVEKHKPDIIEIFLQRIRF